MFVAGGGGDVCCGVGGCLLRGGVMFVAGWGVCCGVGCLLRGGVFVAGWGMFVEGWGDVCCGVGCLLRGGVFVAGGIVCCGVGCLLRGVGVFVAGCGGVCCGGWGCLLRGVECSCLLLLAGCFLLCCLFDGTPRMQKGKPPPQSPKVPLLTRCFSVQDIALCAPPVDRKSASRIPAFPAYSA